MPRHRPIVSRVALALTLAVSAAAATAQEAPYRLVVDPPSLALRVGDTVRVTARVVDAAGRPVDAQIRFFSRARNELAVSRDGEVIALRGGGHMMFVLARAGDAALRAEVPVSVEFPPLERVVIRSYGERLYVGSGLRHRATVIDASGADRPEVTVAWSTSDPSVATVDRAGVLTAHREGVVTLQATADGIRGEHRYRVVPNPVRTVRLSVSADSVRTGDVVRVTAQALDAAGRPVADAPIQFAVLSYPEDTAAAQFPPAEVDEKGRFVAYKAGTYTVLAMAPGYTARHSITVGHRHVSRRVEVVGQGAVRDVRTSDLWVWEGVDGRDYAVTGTWGAAGAAYFWDVTDPAHPALIDSVVVDARTVNDVKVSEDGRVCVITREGASNRRNGIVILDCTNPRDVKILSTFDDGLTGGVHNVFVYRHHVYAVNNGVKFDIINIEDPRNPRRVAVFELDTPGHAIHDVWVVDGIAYSSNWSDGLVLIDVGNGVAGGSPERPVKITQFSACNCAHHAAFPYRSSTGRFYVLMGDEIGRPSGGPPDREGEKGGTPEAMAGYIHFIDFTDPLNPEEVARYEVPEAGSHNFWIEGDTLYAAFYNGGLRVVDISGELKGNLTYQNREIARFFAFDPQGFVANAAFTWGPQPYKGNVFIAEHYSGLWAVKLLPREQTLVP